MDGLAGDFLAENSSGRNSDGPRHDLAEVTNAPLVRYESAIGAPESLAARRYANRPQDMIAHIKDFAKWVVVETSKFIPSAEASYSVVFPELPAWYDRITFGLLSKQAAQPSQRVHGMLDIALAHGHTEYMASISPAAINWAATESRRLWAGRDLPTLEPDDVVAALTSALGAEMTHSDRELSQPIRMVGPDLMAIGRNELQKALIVHASLSSILWRSRRSRTSFRLVGGWLLLDSDGLLNRAALYPGR